MRYLLTLGLLLWAAAASAFTVNGKTLATWNGKTLVSWNGATLSAAPAQVTGVAASNSPAQITVTWTAVSGATSYNVYYSTTTTPPGTPQFTGRTGTSYSIVGPLTGGTTYYVWVSAVNGVGEGTLSASASAVAAAIVSIATSNPGFESATVAAMWPPSTSTFGISPAATYSNPGASATSERLATALMSGSYAGHVMAQGAPYDNSTESNATSAVASISSAYTRTAIDAANNTVITFDILPLQVSALTNDGSVAYAQFALFKSGAQVANSVVNLVLYGNAPAMIQSSKFTPVDSQKVAVSYDLKAIAQAALTKAGKTWTDFDTISAGYVAYSENPELSSESVGTPIEFLIDNFR